jgi:hypothetical protein
VAIGITLRSENGALVFAVSQESALLNGGRTYRSTLRATQEAGGASVPGSELLDEYLIEVADGDSDLASMEQFLDDSGPGTAVRLSTSGVTTLGNHKTSSRGDTRITLQEDATWLVESVNTAIDHFQFCTVTSWDSRLLCRADCGSRTESVLADSSIAVTYWGFNIPEYKVVSAESQFGQVDWQAGTSTQESGSAGSHGGYSLASTDGAEILVINQGNTTTVEGVQIRSNSYQELLLDGSPRASQAYVATIDPEECAPSEIPVHGQNGAFLWCQPSGEAMPITAWDLSAFTGIYGSIVHGGLRLGEAILRTLVTKVATATLLNGLSGPRQVKPNQSSSAPVSCDQRVDIWTCRGDASMGVLRATHSIEWPAEGNSVPTLTPRYPLVPAVPTSTVQPRSGTKSISVSGSFAGMGSLGSYVGSGTGTVSISAATGSSRASVGATFRCFPDPQSGTGGISFTLTSTGTEVQLTITASGRVKYLTYPSVSALNASGQFDGTIQIGGRTENVSGTATVSGTTTQAGSGSFSLKVEFALSGTY